MGDRATGAATDRIKETAMTVDPEDRSTTGAPPPTHQQPVYTDPSRTAGPDAPIGGPDTYAGPDGSAGPDTLSEPTGPDAAAGGGPTETRPAVHPPLAKPQHTRLSGLWITLTSGAVVLLVLLIFILENGQKIEISFFGAHGHLPLGVALLMAAIFGILVVVIPGAGRMIQLRMLAKRHRKQVAAMQPQPVDPHQPGGAAPAADQQAPVGYGQPGGQGPDGRVPAEPAPEPKKSSWRRSKR